MAQRKKSESRRKTPWDSQEDNQMTPMQRFLRDRYQEHYAQRHPFLSNTGEIELINTVVPAQCPFCHAEQFSRKGHTRSGVQRYVCKCGKTSSKKTWETFHNHIQTGATLIHDEEQAHEELVQNLRLSSRSYNSQSLKNLDDKENPLNPVNQVHRLLQLFLYSHRSFKREELQGHLNLFSFSYNPPEHPLEKVEELLSIAFSRPITLRYRDLYSKSESKSGILL